VTRDNRPRDESRMTGRERSDLAALIRQQERVLKTKAKERSRELLALFEQQAATIYKFDDDAVWKESVKIAEQEVAKANHKIAQRCDQLGIPKRFAPRINFRWEGRSWEFAFKERRAELRRVAQSKIAVLEQAALSKIAEQALQAQTEVVKLGIETRAAKAFLEAMRPLEELMPPLQPPTVQQLLGRRQDDDDDA
jgi:DNA gyrase/topoisomerase IV subunit A